MLTFRNCCNAKPTQLPCNPLVWDLFDLNIPEVKRKMYGDISYLSVHITTPF